MKYFICTLETDNNAAVYMGFPAEKTEQIISISRVQTSVCETENRETFISIPVLFQLKDKTTPHGLVLRNPLRTILLTPKINTEMDIPEESIHRLPESLTGMLKFFRGLCFDGKNLILIFDPDKLADGNI